MGYITFHEVCEAVEVVKSRFGDRVGPYGEIRDVRMWPGRNGIAETPEAMFVKGLVDAGLYEQRDLDYGPSSARTVMLHNSREHILNLREQVRSLGGEPVPGFEL